MKEYPVDYETILVETHEQVGLLRLNRPKALNALNPQLVAELVSALQAFDADEAIRAVVLTGSEKAFAAGADIREMADMSAVDMLKADLIGTWDGIYQVKKPLIAAVSGYALGGGFEVALMCDMIIASETAVFGLPEVSLGIIPGAGGTQRLVREVGKGLAMEVILNDRRLSAEEALALGLVNAVYPTDTYLDEALALAAQIASRPPLAVRFAKEAINQAYETALTEGLLFERRGLYFLFSSEDQTEGMAAFLEKRSPEFKGR
ncbi:MAG: enoyl-CoA hydratase [Chloroflexi bacterium]|nr:enoyl-CoA hydratase [Chloroflexota bacterium]